MDGAGPAEDRRGTQAIKPRASVKALLDVEHGEPAAVAMGGEGVELAGATVVAVAVAEFAAFDFPLGHGGTSSDIGTDPY
jgi:hypothetical protein